MDRFEQRMRQAADEVRETTRTLPRPGVGPGSAPGMPARRGWLVFAAAFAAVVISVGVLPLLDGDDDRTPVGSPDTTTPVEPPSTIVPSTAPPVVCSGSGAILSVERQDLPAAVLYTRADLMGAATGCDIGSLEQLAAPGFTTDFGGGGIEMLAEWEAAGEGKLGILAKILNMGHAEVVYGDGTKDYVWPAAFAYDTWENIPQEHLDELSAIYTPEELDQIAGFGSYAGWRTGISEDGDWRYFVAGD